jgi:Spy/CpxP family protein refolding chaperone
MRKSFVLLTVLGVAIAAGGAGVAVGANGGHVAQRFADTRIGKLIMGRLGRAMTLRSELNLTDQQREAIRQVLQEHRKEIAQAIKPVVQARRDLRSDVTADAPDEAAIHTAADELGKELGDAAVVLAKVKTELKEKANLTPDQLKKIDDFRNANDKSVDEMFQQVENDQ